MHKERILFAGEDAGGALALAPVIKRIEADKSCSVKVISHGTSQRVWAEENIKSQPFGAFPAWLRLGRADTILGDQPTSVLVTGTSWQGDDIEKHLIAAARNRSIPSISVLDFWSNYAERFSGNGPGENLQYLPDTVAVMDEHAALEMVDKGVPRQKLYITGNPHLEDLAKWLLMDKYEAKRRIFEVTGIEPDIGIMLFVSQGIESLHGNNLGFSEKTVLSDLIDARQKQGISSKIVVKLHPNETESKYSTYEVNHQVVVLNQELDPRLLMCAADIVIGMRSTMLVEAVCLRKRTISYQPGLIGPDPMFTNSLGATCAISSAEELRQAIGEANCSDSTLWKRVDRARKKIKLVKSATDNVVKLIHGKANAA